MQPTLYRRVPAANGRVSGVVRGAVLGVPKAFFVRHRRVGRSAFTRRGAGCRWALLLIVAAVRGNSARIWEYWGWHSGSTEEGSTRSVREGYVSSLARLAGYPRE